MGREASDDKCSMLFVVIMSHGERGMIVGTDGETVAVDDILNYFDGRRCPGMAGCPKVFIFQACRNGLYTSTTSGNI